MHNATRRKKDGRWSMEDSGRKIWEGGWRKGSTDTTKEKKEEQTKTRKKYSITKCVVGVLPHVGGHFGDLFDTKSIQKPT